MMPRGVRSTEKQPTAAEQAEQARETQKAQMKEMEQATKEQEKADAEARKAGVEGAPGQDAEYIRMRKEQARREAAGDKITEGVENAAAVHGTSWVGPRVDPNAKPTDTTDGAARTSAPAAREDADPTTTVTRTGSNS
jgi:hypothetical protein